MVKETLMVRICLFRVFRVVRGEYKKITLSNNLTPQLYDRKLRIDLLIHFDRIPVEKRSYIFNGFIHSFVIQRPLPDIWEYNDLVPKGIRIQLNELYKRLACLDYHEREASFEYIFRRINICILILRNERKYPKWLEIRKTRRARAKAKSIKHKE